MPTELAKVWLCLKPFSLQQKDKEPENGLQMLAMVEDMVKQMGYKSSLLAVIFLGIVAASGVDIDVIGKHFLQEEE
ncbi:unnamed protein product [Sphagnum jensenii]|uniref:Uncharacterized protein n=1 Tax=Sphagnum jensenii TaxID=128206 RepID=A0ABP1AR65_9BRYO